MLSRNQLKRDHLDGAQSEEPGVVTLTGKTPAVQFDNPLARYMPQPQVEYPDVGLKNEQYLKKVYVQTWGCQMNVSDTERMLALLGQRNYRPTQSLEEADFILLNTCHIREKARHKVVSRLGELKGLKEKNPNPILAVSGCVAQAEAEKLAQEVPFLDMIFGPDQIEDLPGLLEKAVNKSDELQKSGISAFTTFKTEPIVEAKFTKDPYTIPIDEVPPYLDPRNEVSRFINIIKGCNNFCTFCVVPYTRGREKSRPLSEIIDETKYFVQNGVKEIVLLGQNVNSYGIDLLTDDRDGQKAIAEDKLPFAELLYRVAEVEGVERIRFTTSNPHDFTRGLARAFADLPKLINQFHLPVQSGSNRILDRMNRQYTREEYLERVAWVRSVRPDMAFGTDIIVGFPGETDADFEETMSLVQEMKYSYIFAFKYSERRGTPAARFKDQVPEHIKDERLQRLLKFQQAETERQNLAEIGKVRDVLVLYPNRKEPGTWYGRTYEGRLVKIHSPRSLMGITIPVKIFNANVTALEAHPA